MPRMRFATDMPEGTLVALCTHIRIEDDHWEWDGDHTHRTEYDCGDPVIYCNDTCYSARRLVYLLEHRSIPIGARVQRTCNNPNCVRPQHARLVQNTRCILYQ